MSEFNNRIITQRSILKVVNSSKNYKEPLLSLTGKAIDRWVMNNHINDEKKMILLLKSISSDLFCLANRSQEQISENYEDYKVYSQKISKKILTLKLLISNKNI